MRRYTSMLSVVALAASLIVSAPAMAVEIGIVNVQKIMQESKAAQSVRTQLQAKQKSFQAELDAKQKQLVKEDQDLVNQRSKLSKEAFEQKVKAFQEKAANAQREIQSKKASLDKAVATALNQIQEKVSNISREVAAAEKKGLVIASSQVIYGDASLDITNKVLTRLNSELPSVAIKF